jgi:hypothetical protein
MVSEGTLPSEDELDRRAPLSWVAPLVPAVPLVIDLDEDPLGGPADGCPADVHARMIELFAAGGVPQTSAKQRLKQKVTPGESYKIPDALQEAFDFGYINPNLNPPDGHRWVRRGVGWQLAPRGG